MTLLPSDLASYSPSGRRELLAAFADSGLDHVHCGDHVSFHDGYRWDGFVSASTFLALNDTLHVHLGLYLLPLRHPMTVARQLATLWEYAGSRPGRSAELLKVVVGQASAMDAVFKKLMGRDIQPRFEFFMQCAPKVDV